MLSDCDMRLTSMGPITEAEVHIRCYAEGWRLYIKHRHFGGRLKDCSADVYERLSIDELSDVLCAHLATMGPLSGI